MISTEISKIIPSIEEEYDSFQTILGTYSWYPGEHVGEDTYWENYFEGDVKYPNSLDPDVADRVQRFLERVNKEEYNNLSKDLQKKYEDIMVSTDGNEPTDEEVRLINYLIGFRNMMGECYSYEEID